MNIVNIINNIEGTDATIFIAIGPIYNSIAVAGFAICLYAAISRRVCTKDRATAAAIHVLMAVWLLLMWRDHAVSTVPILLSLIVRSLILLVTIILVFAARLTYVSHRAVIIRKKKNKVLHD